MPGNSSIVSVCLWLLLDDFASSTEEQKRRRPVMPVPSMGARQLSDEDEDEEDEEDEEEKNMKK